MRLRARCPSILLPLVFGLPGSLAAQARLVPAGPRFEVSSRPSGASPRWTAACS